MSEEVLSTLPFRYLFSKISTQFKICSLAEERKLKLNGVFIYNYGEFEGINGKVAEPTFVTHTFVSICKLY